MKNSPKVKKTRGQILPLCSRRHISDLDELRRQNEALQKSLDDVTSLATELRDENDRLHEENQQVREMVQLPVNFSHLQVCVVL